MMNSELEQHLAPVAAFRRMPAATLPREILGFECPQGLLALLEFSDGFVTRDGIFRVFGVTPSEQLPALVDWNQSEWKQGYEHLAEGLLFIAEDIFGDQYGYSFRGAKREFIKFYCEGGEVETLAGVDWFLEAIAAPVESGAIDGDLIAAAASLDLHPASNEHLAFKVPLIINGKRAAGNLAIESTAIHLGMLSQLSLKNSYSPDGQQIAQFSLDSERQTPRG